MLFPHFKRHSLSKPICPKPPSFPQALFPFSQAELLHLFLKALYRSSLRHLGAASGGCLAPHSAKGLGVMRVPVQGGHAAQGCVGRGAPTVLLTSSSVTPRNQIHKGCI